ncbi:hypothetical protein Ancab_002132 [Ancistrocladus abbreviatus]
MRQPNTSNKLSKNAIEEGKGNTSSNGRCSVAQWQWTVAVTGEFVGKSTTKELATQSRDSSHSMPFNNSDQLQLRNGSTGGRSSASQTEAGLTRWLGDQI